MVIIALMAQLASAAIGGYNFLGIANGGGLIAGGRVYIYIDRQDGSRAYATSYLDERGRFVNMNPVMLDANARARIWLRPGRYHLVLLPPGDITRPNEGVIMREWFVVIEPTTRKPKLK